jgi:hypothetical protein
MTFQEAYDALASAQFWHDKAKQDATKALGDAIRREMTDNEESQAAFARRHGISKAHVTDILAGRRYSPSLAQNFYWGAPKR